ncbi:MFS transporter [Alteraurantiacibacter aquimixticola]|uniref:MFS transporter n=1 Tax=Alteraurantiacibacter aquimixticola TaxID=2489173 RepID=A0A4T3F3X3_9SPHN|nr:MFS transporter [Alteraurantiacibacter aquimixticola]TIX51471.1 MFS transporter [Alteraurantiacibacter aquimixticola]
MATQSPAGGISFVEALNRTSMKPFQWLIVATCMLVLVCDGIDLQLLGIIAPLVMEDFGVDRSTFGLAMGAALVGFGLGSAAGGVIGDRVGRRYALALAALVFSLATIGAGTSTGVWSMAFWRLIGGLGFGAAYANALTMASEWTSDKWRPITVSTLSVGTPIGGTIVGWIGPDLAAARGWDGTFTFFGFATLSLVVIVLVVLKDSPAFLLGQGKAEQAKKHAAHVLDGDVALVADGHEHGGGEFQTKGILDPSYKRLNIGIGLAFAAAAMVAYSILSWSTTFLTAAGFTLGEAGNAVSIGGITSMIGSIIVGAAMRHFGSRPVLVVIGTVLMAVLVWLAWAVESLPEVPSASDKTLVTALIGASGAFFSAGIAGMYVIMAAGYPSSIRSTGIGLGILMSRVGAVSATAFGGWLLDVGGTSVVPFFVVLTASAAIILAAAFIVDRHVPPARSV